MYKQIVLKGDFYKKWSGDILCGLLSATPHIMMQRSMTEAHTNIFCALVLERCLYGLLYKSLLI